MSTPNGIRVRRIAAGLTQEALAKATHLSRQRLNLIEGGATPSLPVAMRLARRLGTDVATLFHELSQAEAGKDSGSATPRRKTPVTTIRLLVSIDIEEGEADPEAIRANVQQAVGAMRTDGLAPADSDAVFGEVTTRVMDIHEFAQEARRMGGACTLFVTGDVTAFGDDEDKKAEFLGENRKYIEDAMATAGNIAIDTLGGTDDEEGELDDEDQDPA